MRAHCACLPLPPAHPSPMCDLQSQFCSGDLHSQGGFLSCLSELVNQGEPFVGDNVPVTPYFCP